MFYEDDDPHYFDIEARDDLTHIEKAILFWDNGYEIPVDLYHALVTEGYIVSVMRDKHMR